MLLSEVILMSLTEATGQSVSTVRNIIRSNFNRRGLGVELSGHSRDQSASGDRGAAVKESRLLEAFSKILRLYDEKDPKLMAVQDVVRRTQKPLQLVFKYPHDNTFTNIPCAVVPDYYTRSGIKFVIKTIMVKPDFHPHSTRDIVFVLSEL